MSIPTPETLTFEHIKAWDPQTMREQMRHPEMREAIINAVKNRPLEDVLEAQAKLDAQATVDPPAEPVAVVPTPEELAATEAQKKAAEEAAAAETARIAAEQEAARKAAEPPKKWITDYQCKDDDGNPLGRPTHLEALSPEELIEKMKIAHEQAVRAFHRLKKQKVSFKDQQPAAPTGQLSDVELLAAMKDLKSDDPQKQLDAIRKVQQAEAEKARAEAEELARQKRVSQQFLTDHKHDFNNCQANVELVKEYFLENQLQWTYDNLEIAFHALESRLAPVEPVAPVVPVNPVPPAPVVTAPKAVPAVTVPPAASPAVQPATTVPAPAAAPANPVPPAPRPGVNGGLQPGSLSATRPASTPTKGLTAEEIKSWSPEMMKAKMRNPADRALIEKFVQERNQGKK